MTEGNKTCTGPRFPRFLMNKVQDSCTGPRFPRIPRFLGTLPGSSLIVPQNLGILGNLGPVHESCTLFIRNLGNLGPVQGFVTSKMEKAHQTCTGPRFPRFLMNIVQDSCTGPRFPRNQDFEELSGKTWQSSKKSWDSWEILGLCMNPALCSSGILGILGLCRFGELSPSLKSQNLHRPKIPKIPDEQSAGFMHRPKIPKNPKILRNYQARPWQSSQKSWDSWESWACAWILHFVHQDSWESWACAGLVSFPHHWSHKTCTGPRFPRFLMNKVQDSCTGPRFPRIPRFLGTIKQDPDKVPKNLEILGNLGPVHESCT